MPPLPTPTLQTPRLRLRPFTPADIAAIFALQSDPIVMRYAERPPWTEQAQAERFITVSQEMAQEGRGARLAIERQTDGAFLGTCNIFNWNQTNRNAKLGYSLTTTAWGQGIATEACRALLHWAFRALNLHRVQSETHPDNIASNRVLEKLGFIHEGTLREDCIVNDEITDSKIYGLLRRDWTG
ncbi:hypothetical protein ACOSOMT5_P0527 [Acidiphilium sp. MT5]